VGEQQAQESAAQLGVRRNVADPAARRLRFEATQRRHQVAHAGGVDALDVQVIAPLEGERQGAVGRRLAQRLVRVWRQNGKALDEREVALLVVSEARHRLV
jgi:hypothetical protein